MQTEHFETGSGGFVWQNIQPDELFSRLQFHVYTAFDMVVGEEWAGSQFINHYNRIYYVKSGQGYLQFKEHKIHMRPGHLYLIPPYQLLSHSCEGELHFMWTHFQANIGDGLDLFMFYGQACEVDCRQMKNMESDFTHLIENVKFSSASALLERNRILLALLHPFMCIFDKGGSKSNWFRHQSLLPSLNIMNRDIANPPSLKSLAAAANVSPEHFSRKFKSAFNISPKRYMLQKRIAFAKQRLLLGTQSIDEVAEQCGFCDIFHFSRTFKKETTLSPSEFRKIYNIDKANT